MASLARRAQSARVGRVIGLVRRTAFLFDLDGTLVDSNNLHERVFREVLRDYVPQLLDGFDYEVLKGKPTAECFRHLGIGEGGVLASLVTEKQQRYRAAVLRGELRLMPGARSILRSLAKRGKRMFVVTGGSRRSVEAALTATGIHGFFEAVITADDVARGKPAPDCFLLCVERFGIKTAEALAIEDSISGVEAARTAGLDVVMVNNPSLQKQFSNLVEFRLAWMEQEACAYA
jgi:HAD superfamily hydrolase (TIGR01509 family)